MYQTRESWAHTRRVIAKAEHLEKGANPRFVVTSLPSQDWAARALYEDLYCARGEMENRIKEQLMLFSDRTSTADLRSNQIRLYFSSVAYLLMQALRRLGLQGTELAKAQCTTLRLKLLKIGALMRITVRKGGGCHLRVGILIRNCFDRSMRSCRLYFCDAEKTTIQPNRSPNPVGEVCPEAPKRVLNTAPRTCSHAPNPRTNDPSCSSRPENSNSHALHTYPTVW